MAKIMVFANQKGGVGKTTSAVNIGAFIAEKGKKVLLVDFDPQANLSSSVGVKTDTKGIYELITHPAFADGNPAPRTVLDLMRDFVYDTTVTKLKIIPSSINLTGATVELVNVDEREYYLRRVLEALSPYYDYIFIDCPPSLGLLTLNGLVASGFVLIPLQCEYFALEGLTQLLKTIQQVQKALNPRLQIGGIMFTMYDRRTRLAHEVVQEVTGYFKEKVFRTIIPRNIRISEAPSYSRPINQYDPECVGAKSYNLLAEEVLANV